MQRTLQTLRKKYHVTQQGLRTLQAKLQTLQTERLRYIKRLRTLRSQQSTNMFAEDSMAIQTLSSLRFMEAEIERLEAALANADIIETTELKKPEVQIGSSVRLAGERGEITYTIVSSLEADPFDNKISEESPLGRLLLGKRLKDFITLPKTLRYKARSMQLIGIE